MKSDSGAEIASPKEKGRRGPKVEPDGEPGSCATTESWVSGGEQPGLPVSPTTPSPVLSRPDPAFAARVEDARQSMPIPSSRIWIGQAKRKTT